jgi:hypothetical protein
MAPRFAIGIRTCSAMPQDWRLILNRLVRLSARSSECVEHLDLRLNLNPVEGEIEARGA